MLLSVVELANLQGTQTLLSFLDGFGIHGSAARWSSREGYAGFRDHGHQEILDSSGADPDLFAHSAIALRGDFDKVLARRDGFKSDQPGFVGATRQVYAHIGRAQGHRGGGGKRRTSVLLYAHINQAVKGGAGVLGKEYRHRNALCLQSIRHGERKKAAQEG